MHIRGVPAKKQLSRELAILNDGYFQSRRPSLLSLVQRLQVVQTRSAARALQLDLITELGAVEKVAREIDQERGSAARARRDALKLIELKTPEVRRELAQVQDVFDRLKHMHVVVNAFRHVVRTIADGLVWRLFDYDRTALALLATREAVAKHAPENGLQEELKAMDRLEGALDTIVIHNDSTYCLRHGDVTAVIEVDGRRFPYLEEVKAGRSEAVRQRQAIAAALKRIRAGRLLVPVDFDTHIPRLASPLAKARATGYAEMKIDCRFVQVIDYRHFGGREERVAEIIRDADRRLGWLGTDRLILASIAGASRIHDRGDPVAEIAPISIFPLPAADVVDLLMGTLDLRVHLNAELLALKFRERGISVEFATGESARQHFLYATRGYLGLNVPAYVREQMLAELMTTESLVNLVEWVLDSGMTVAWSQTGETPVVGFTDERAAWIAAGERIALTR
jgi:hypothetical protein